MLAQHQLGESTRASSRRPLTFPPINTPGAARGAAALRPAAEDACAAVADIAAVAADNTVARVAQAGGGGPAVRAGASPSRAQPAQRPSASSPSNSLRRRRGRTG